MRVDRERLAPERPCDRTGCEATVLRRRSPGSPRRCRPCSGVAVDRLSRSSSERDALAAPCRTSPTPLFVNPPLWYSLGLPGRGSRCHRSPRPPPRRARHRCPPRGRSPVMPTRCTGFGDADDRRGAPSSPNRSTAAGTRRRRRAARRGARSARRRPGIGRRSRCGPRGRGRGGGGTIIVAPSPSRTVQLGEAALELRAELVHRGEAVGRVLRHRPLDREVEPHRTVRPVRRARSAAAR